MQNGLKRLFFNIFKNIGLLYFVIVISSLTVGTLSFFLIGQEFIQNENLWCNEVITANLFITCLRPTDCQKRFISTNFNFDSFKEFHNKKFQHIDDNFLEWFIGFTEHYFRVNVLEDLGALIHLFNGNLVLPNRRKRFLDFIEIYNNKMLNQQRRLEKQKKTWPKIKEIIQPKLSEVIPTQNDGWLSGFTDAEGCFCISFRKKAGGVSICFSIEQKGTENSLVLSGFNSIFRVGTCYNTRRGNVYKFAIEGISKCFKVYPYFEKFPLRAVKKEAFEAWKSVHLDISEKKHLDLKYRDSIIVRSKEINTLNKGRKF